MRLEQILPLLVERLSDELQAVGARDGLCFIGVLPGAQVPLDYALDCGGMAWVRIAQAYPTQTFPQQATQFGNCAYDLGVPMEMGVMRTATSPSSFGNAVNLPTAEDQFADTLGAIRDMRAMKDAILSLREEIDLVILGTYTPYGPEGVAVGGSWSFTIGEE